MSNELTWPDVAPYYLNAQPPIKVVIQLQPPYGLDHFFLSSATLDGVAFGLPELREFDSINEEEARELYQVTDGHTWNLDASCRHWFLKDGIQDRYWHIKEVHWLIHRGFNIFGVHTYKEAKP